MYQSLKKIYYKDRTQYETAYQQRLDSFGVLKTSLFPYLMKQQDFSSSQYPLFALPILENQLLMQEVIVNSQLLDQKAHTLPLVAHQQLYQELLFDTIVATNEIEGIKTTRKDISVAVNHIEKQKAKREIRHLSTVRMYLNILSDEDFQINHVSDIRNLYDRLMEGEVSKEDKPDGQFFRNSMVLIKSMSGKTEHVPPQSEEKIIEMMEAWITFINDREIPFLFKATLGHFFFENVHPFFDGNGRCGRYILSKYLSKRLDKFSGLVISKKINEEKNSYYKAFSQTGDVLNRADGTLFVKTLLTYIVKGQTEILEQLTEKEMILSYYTKKIQGDQLESSEQAVLLALLQSQLFATDRQSIWTDAALFKELEGQANSQRALKRAMTSLEEKGIVKKIEKRPLKHMIQAGFVDEGYPLAVE